MPYAWTRSLTLRHLAASRAPILVGPWRSEVGFHALYFQPWLAAWRTKYSVDPDRITVVAPAGSAVWHHTCRPVELFDHLSMTHVRQGLYAASAQDGTLKQNAITAQDRRLLALVASTQGLRRYSILHPSLMYQDLAPWFSGHMPLSDVVHRLTIPGAHPWPPLSVPVLPLALVLPEKFVAVKFYGRPTFPLREDIRTWVETLVERLSAQIPVVLLESGLDADDHQDFVIPLSDRVTSTAPHCTVSNHLALQSAVLAQAAGFVGTYGGAMQLALRLGKPSLGFYTEFTGTCYAHKLLAEYLAVQQGTPCWIGRPGDLDVVKALGGL